MLHVNGDRYAVIQGRMVANAEVLQEEPEMVGILQRLKATKNEISVIADVARYFYDARISLVYDRARASTELGLHARSASNTNDNGVDGEHSTSDANSNATNSNHNGIPSNDTHIISSQSVILDLCKMEVNTEDQEVKEK